MADPTLDERVDEGTRAVLADAVRSGHCELLPPHSSPAWCASRSPATRRWPGLRPTLRAAPPDGTVLLLAGAQHASRDRGVPMHLARIDATLPVRVVMFGEASSGLVADERRPAVFAPQDDHCEALRKQLATPPAASAASR